MRTDDKPDHLDLGSALLSVYLTLRELGMRFALERSWHNYGYGKPELTDGFLAAEKAKNSTDLAIAALREFAVEQEGKYIVLPPFGVNWHPPEIGDAMAYLTRHGYDPPGLQLLKRWGYRAHPVKEEYHDTPVKSDGDHVPTDYNERIAYLKSRGIVNLRPRDVSEIFGISHVSAFWVLATAVNNGDMVKIGRGSYVFKDG